MEPLYRITMLGSLRVRIGDRWVTRFHTQKAGALLAYLAFHPEQHPRETLADMLWPDSELESARASLSQALSMLRRQLEPPGVPAGGVIVSSKSHVGLNPSAIETDVAEFHSALRKGRLGANRADRIQSLQEAIELYQGELLPGFYEEWVQTEQRRLADLYFQAVENLLGLLAEAEDYLQALDYARRVVAIDPLREESHQQAMRLYAAAGRAAEALEQFKELERILEQELGAQPSAASRELVEQIKRQPAPALPAPPARNSQLSTLNPQLPRGTVTFLLTDMAGSTAMWEKAGDAFRNALEAHHRLMRTLFTEHGGHEVKEAGESFLVAFESPIAALTCAIACQKTVDGLLLRVEGQADNSQPSNLNPQLRVRMALHTGEVKLEEGEYHGIVLHRASRILTAAHGGQILASEALSFMLRRDLPAGVQLVDLGVYRLRDVQAPERLFQVNYDGMPQTDFPALNAEAGYQSNLPLQFTRFFGREEQLAQLSEMLQSGHTRLVTITGPGGTGKTRLALEVANRLLEPFAGAVWFVPLVDLSDPQLIAGAIVDALRIPRPATAEPLDQAVLALNRQPSLLVLDNLEQFVEEGGQVVRALLERVPLLTCLVTSRQSLGLLAERESQLAPLATPNGPGTPERLTMFESVRLFVDRAQAVKPDFQVTNQNAPAVAELCDRLEGIPLAIELAAARASVLSPSQMLLQLENRFDFLVSRRRDATDRHRTLRAVMEWSYRSLPPETQGFFAQLSVFRGGWTLESASEVTGDHLALEHLEHLRACSLVQAADYETGMRFRMLESIREYAEAQLTPEERAAAGHRHLDFAVRFAEEAEPGLTGADQQAWLERLEADHDNLRAALGFALQLSTESGLRLSGALWPFWYVRGYFGEGRMWCRSALEREVDADRTAVRAKALNGAGALAYRQGDYASARSLYEESLSIRRERGDRRGIALSLNNLGLVAQEQGDYASAPSLFEESLSIGRELGDRRGIAMSLNNLGMVAQDRGDYASSRSLFEEALTINQDLGNREWEAANLNNLGILTLHQGDYASARSLSEESLSIRRELGDRSGIALSLNNLGKGAREQGDYVSARSLFEESLSILRELGNRVGIAHSLSNLGSVAHEQGDYASARSLYQESLSIRRELGDRQGIAASLEAFAGLAAALSQSVRVARLWGAAEALREEIGSPLSSNDRDQYDESVAAAREALGDDAFSTARAEGRAMTLEQAVDYALSEKG